MEFDQENNILTKEINQNKNRASDNPDNQSSTIETYQPQNQDNYTKIDLEENDITNIKIEDKGNLDEEIESTTKITNRIIKADNPAKTYEKRIISKIITKEGPNHTTIIKTSNIVNDNNKHQNHNKVTYTRPLPQGKYKNIKKKKVKNILPKTNINQNNNSNILSTSQTDRSNNYNKKENNILTSSQSFAVKKIYLNHPEFSNGLFKMQRALSPELNSIKRKTINRGEEIKNVQITHIICSSKPSNFHITEKLETDNIKSNPIQISKVNKDNLSKGGKSFFSSSCYNVKPITQNLKGKTTVYQHARGIGMTNDKRGNINPLFYNSEIKKLSPIIKEKEKVKVEYIENFRSNKNKNNNTIISSTRSNINEVNGSTHQYQNYNIDRKERYIPNTTRIKI